MSEVNKTVEGFIKELKENPSSRFSKGDFQMLIYYILSDRDFKAKKYLLRAAAVVEEDIDISGGMYRFLDKLLKHAGISKAEERVQVLDTFTYGSRDIEWVADAVDEATWIYTECGKNMRMFRAKMLQLTVQKMVRTGRYDGKITYKKKVVDRLLEMERRKMNNE